MSGVAWTSMVANAVQDYIVADVKNRIYFGAAGGAAVALIALNHFGILSSSKKEEVVFFENERVVAKTLIVGACTVTGGALGLLASLRP